MSQAHITIQLVMKNLKDDDITEILLKHFDDMTED